jgi:hypothetical protein
MLQRRKEGRVVIRIHTQQNFSSTLLNVAPKRRRCHWNWRRVRRVQSLPRGQSCRRMDRVGSEPAGTLRRVAHGGNQRGRELHLGGCGRHAAAAARPAAAVSGSSAVPHFDEVDCAVVSAYVWIEPAGKAHAWSRLLRILHDFFNIFIGCCPMDRSGTSFQGCRLRCNEQRGRHRGGRQRACRGQEIVRCYKMMTSIEICSV